MSKYNPLRELYREESDRRPHARTLRGGYFKKVKDTFWALAGEPGKHFGFIAYVSLGSLTFTWCMKVFENEKEPESVWGKSLKIAKQIIALFLILPSLIWAMLERFMIIYPLAALITAIAAVTIIPAIQFFTWAISYSPMEKIRALQVHAAQKTLANGKDNQNVVSEKMSSIKMLGGLLTANGEDLDSIQVAYVAGAVKSELENAMVWNMKQQQTTLGFDSDGNDFFIEMNEYNDGLFVFEEGIVFCEKQKRSCRHFALSQDQYLELNRARDMKVELLENLEKYMPPYLRFFKKEPSFQLMCLAKKGDKPNNDIAYLPVGSESLKKKENHESIQALLELNVGGMSLDFDDRADQNFKQVFADESSRPTMQM